VSLLIDKANSLPRTPRPDDAQQACLLAEQLGYLPLALTHAAAYVGELDLAFDAYLKEFDEALQFHEEEVIEYDSDPENSKLLKTVATTYFLSIDRLGPVEKALLRAASFLAPAPIPIAMFADCPEEVNALVGLWGEETGEASAGKSVRDALTELVHYSLIARDADVFTIHRMERLVLSHKVPKDRVPRWIEATRAALVRYGPDETAENPTTWPVWDRLRPHAEALVRAAQADRRVEPSLTLMIGLGQLYYGKGLYAENLAIDEAALGIAGRVDGAESAAFASRQLAYGETLRALGRYPEAEAAFRKCLAINERLHGFESVSVASVLNYVAISVGDQGRLGEQEDLLRKALTIYESEANIDEASADKDGFGKILNNLGAILVKKGSFDEAERMLRRTLAHFEEAFGREHPRALESVHKLAVLLYSEGDYSAAEPLFRRALEARELVLGSEHPDTLATLLNLTELLAKAGRTDESAALRKEYAARMAAKEARAHNGRLPA
jgi:tetratricopeptide (TPR) repeat protein